MFIGRPLVTICSYWRGHFSKAPLVTAVLAFGLASCSDQAQRFSFNDDFDGTRPLLTPADPLGPTGETRSDAASEAVINRFGQLLSQFVDPTTGLVHYEKWQQDAEARDTLDGILVEFARARVFGDERQLVVSVERAFEVLINAYNAHIINLIVDHWGEVQNKSKCRDSASILNAFGSNPWQLYKFDVAGFKDSSLDELENKLIRPLGDARIHFALNCASVGCPKLIATPYRATTMERQLQEVTRKFVNSGRDTQFERAAKKTTTSQILNWFGADFLAPSEAANWPRRPGLQWASLSDFFSDYYDESGGLSRREIKGFDVQYSKYDWALNWTKAQTPCFD